MMSRWMLVLFPNEGIFKSKTGQWDESVRLDHSWTQWAGEYWELLTRGRAPDALLWPFSHSDLVREFGEPGAATKAATITSVATTKASTPTRTPMQTLTSPSRMVEAATAMLAVRAGHR